MTSRNDNCIATISRQLLLCSALLLPLNVESGDAIRTELFDNTTYESVELAVKAMKANCLHESKRENAEHMGAILQNESGQFLVTHGAAAQDQESVTFSIRKPASLKLVALWHTHGKPGRDTERFSIEDGDTVRDTGLPFYLITPKGDIKVLEKRKKGMSGKDYASSNTAQRTYVRKFRGLVLFRLT